MQEEDKYFIDIQNVCKTDVQMKLWIKLQYYKYTKSY